MTSERQAGGFDGEAAPREAYVWLWLPGHHEPVVAGRLVRDGDMHVFNYGRSYLERGDARPIYLPELPLVRGALLPQAPLDMAGALRDAAPDAWGRRVIINRLMGLKGVGAHAVEFDELTYLLHSGSDRIGALDFQTSPDRYRPREAENATLEELLEAAERVDRGEPIPPALDKALFHGSSIGGARPKALIEDGQEKFIAKFSATNDTYAIVKAEYVAMRLAKEAAGLTVAAVRLVKANGKDVLLVKRFDRERTGAGWTRRAMVSALTLLGLSEMQARYASYHDLTDIIRARFTEPRDSLRELYGRMVFNVLSGNTDDHARNHAAFWNGESLALTPAYDLCPQQRTGREANQAMLIGQEDRRSRLETCRLAASAFLLNDVEARALIHAQIDAIGAAWDGICDEADLSKIDRAFLWRRQFLNDYAFEGFGR
ncbi:type II toxin-antitoxin system HipA family toxin [Rhodospirillum rubrum]|nr:type II toxin-antitoxin system HipA family toxin [Rhodospirillum rubrum]MBK5953630.1 phosphatidylinositol kinase [Rhodospirillum rubrum]QXG81700.1 type II toxin-antitoxin system HipA family toxin [Rhodospirillum rubrum]HAQ00227.1 type II toxin-antitoxin system HipA family toxin [Rhodospirillum rubrum]HCF16820.1 type II toxin-antitoxin system HipA family toxin [Rhodospirillum rubrum]